MGDLEDNFTIAELRAENKKLTNRSAELGALVMVISGYLAGKGPEHHMMIQYIARDLQKLADQEKEGY